MRFGVARDFITPHVATHMGGYGSLYGKWFRGIHDDLYVKALLLDDGSSKVLLMAFDLLAHDQRLTQRAAEYLQSQHHIPPENVVLAYTHNHAGPAIEGYDPGQHSDAYEELLWERTMRCIDRAFVNRFEGTAFFGSIQGDWSISRRKPVDGSIVSLPNLAGARDDTLNIIRICDTDMQDRALLLNYACHPVTLQDTLWISGEYPGRLCQLLEATCYGATALFFQGAGGDTRPRITAGADGWKACTFDEVDDMATAMASGVRRAICGGKLKPIEFTLAARRFVIELETEVYPKAFFRKVVDDPHSSGPARNEAQVVLDRYDTTDNAIELHAGIVKLNDGLYLAHMGGEVCYEVKQVVEEAFGDKNLIFLGFTDGTAYIPGDRMLQEGGYEVDGSVVEYMLKGRFRPGINDKVREAYSLHLEAL